MDFEKIEQILFGKYAWFDTFVEEYQTILSPEALKEEKDTIIELLEFAKEKYHE